MLIYPSPINRMVKSVKADLLLNINGTHNVFCTTYFAIVWCKKYCWLDSIVHHYWLVNFWCYFNELLFCFIAQTTCWYFVEYSVVYYIGLNQPWPICLAFDVSCWLLNFCLNLSSKSYFYLNSVLILCILD